MATTPRTPPEPRLSAIVLAAGLSRRMGGRNKLLLPVGGVPLVRRSVQTLLGYPLAEVVVVTGHEARRVEAALEGLPVRLVFNADYEAGQMTSVRKGLAAVDAQRGVAGVLVCLADQPALTTDDVRAIAEEFLARLAQGGCPVLVPTFRGVRGNPIVLAATSLEDILSRGGNFGCRQFVARNADVARTFEAPNDHVVTDLDLPEDYAALEHA